MGITAIEMAEGEPVCVCELFLSQDFVHKNVARWLLHAFSRYAPLFFFVLFLLKQSP